MIIHRCNKGDKISINRIAADDNPQQILQIFHDCQKTDKKTRAELDKAGIRLLTESDEPEIRKQLFGND